jgi:hypothetical protein
MAKEEIKTNEVKVDKKDDIEYTDEEILTPENKAILKKFIQGE